MVRVYKTELDAMIEAVAKMSRDLTKIVAAVRIGSTDAEVEITEAILDLNALANHLRALRRRETATTPVTTVDPVTPQGTA